MSGVATSLEEMFLFVTVGVFVLTKMLNVVFILKWVQQKGNHPFSNFDPFIEINVTDQNRKMGK